MMKMTRNSGWPNCARLAIAICLVAVGRTGVAAEPADLAYCAQMKGGCSAMTRRRDESNPSPKPSL
jgi:hypothetical protein